MKISIKKNIIACLTFITFISQAQTGSPSTGSPSTGSPSTGSPSTGSPSTGSPSTEPIRVSFTIKNPSLKSKMVDFKSYSAEKERFTSGYGYGLNGLASHAVNLPVPVYVFKEKNGKNELAFIVTEKDNGKTFNINEEYEISREQYLEVARAEMNQRNFE